MLWHDSRIIGNTGNFNIEITELTGNKNTGNIGHAVSLKMLETAC